MEVQEFDMPMMPIKQIISEVTKICKECFVEHLDLFGSFATGTALPTIDIFYFNTI